MSGEWFHASRTTIKRSEGRSVVAAAAYRTASSIECEREGVTHDYTRKGGVKEVFVTTPEGKAGMEWAQDVSALTNAMEAAEKRKDAQVGHEWLISLPSEGELNDTQRSALSHTLSQRLSDLYGVASIGAIHAPGREGDQRNEHVHLLFTSRVVEADGELGTKVTSITDRKTSAAEVTRYRQIVADTINEALEEAGSTDFVDARSFKERGIDRAPTEHLGPAATNKERRSPDSSQRQDANRDIIEERIAEQRELMAAIAARRFDEAPPEALTLETERDLARRFGEEWREPGAGGDAMPQPVASHGWQETSPAGDVGEAMQAETERVQATGTTHWHSAVLGRMRAATEALFELLRDESGVAPEGDPDREAEQPRGWLARIAERGRALWAARLRGDEVPPVEDPPDADALIRDLAAHAVERPPDEPHRDPTRPVATAVDAPEPDGRPQPQDVSPPPVAPPAPEEDLLDRMARLWGEDMGEGGDEWPPAQGYPEPDILPEDPEPYPGPDMEPDL